MNYDKKELIIHNTFIVKHMASKFYLGDFNIEYEELLSSGMNGLLHAVDEFNTNIGLKFSIFASNHIKKQMLGYIRRIFPFSREDSILIKELCDNSLNEFLAPCSNSEVDEMIRCSKFDIDISTRNKCLLFFTVYLDDFLFDSNEVKSADSTSFFLTHIKELSYLEKVILSLYYKDDLTYFQIGEVLNISQSTVFNIHMIALSKLRYLFKKNNKKEEALT